MDFNQLDPEIMQLPSEHEELSHLLALLPAKVIRGLFTVDVTLSSLDVSSEYIAVGTNVGVVYLYDRPSKVLSKLNTNTKQSIMCVQLLRTVDYVVAVGTSAGVVTFFQMPSILPGGNNQLRMYTLKNIHTSSISALCWSQNGLRLFSGDDTGTVVCSNIDYTMGQTESITLCRESHAVIQLEYAHQLLLISTRYRTVICNIGLNSEISQVGSNIRKSLGNFGGCFMSGSYSANSAKLYCVRPGFRVWKADTSGKVLTTSVYKTQILENTTALKLLPTTTKPTIAELDDKNFGRILPYLGKLLLTYHASSLYILDPDSGKLLACQHDLGNIQSLCVCDDEIFMLRHNSSRAIIRLALKPLIIFDAEQVGKSTSPSRLPLPIADKSPINKLLTTDFAHLLHDVKEKIQSGIQEGQHTTNKTPWGYVNDSDTSSQKELPSPDLDSCKEASSGCVSAEVSPDKELHGDGHSVKIPGADEEVLQAVITGDRHNIDITMTTRSKREEGLNESDQIGGSNDPDIGNTNAQTVISTNASVFFTSKLDAIGNASFSDDIVFRPKARKMKKKKVKHKDKDTDSISSADSISRGVNVIRDSCELTGVMLEGPNSAKITETPLMELLDSNPDVEQVGNLMVQYSPEVVDIPENLENYQQEVSVNFQPVNMSPTEILNSTDNQFSTNQISSIVIQGQQCEDIRKKRVSLTEQRSKQFVEGISDVKTESDEMINDEACEENIDTMTTNNVDKKSTEDDTSIACEVHPEMSKELSLSNDIPLDEQHVDQCSDHNEETTATPLTLTMPDIMCNSPQHSNTNCASPIPDLLSGSHKDGATNSPPHRTNALFEPERNEIEDYMEHHNEDKSHSLFGTTNLQPSFADILDNPSGYQSMPVHLPSKDIVVHEVDTNESSHPSLTLDADLWVDYQMLHQQTKCLSASNTMLWAVGDSQSLQYAKLGGPGLLWVKAKVPAQQIATSLSGSIVWRLQRGTVYAVIGGTVRKPTGDKWMDVAKNVKYIAVDDTSAWYIKTSGDILMQKGLSRVRPCFSPHKIPSQQNINICRVACLDGVVWGATKEHRLVVRQGITDHTPEGTTWDFSKCEHKDIAISSLSMGDLGTVWVVYEDGSVWFTHGVCRKNPKGSGRWWQITISDYITQDTVTVKSQCAQYIPHAFLYQSTGGSITINNKGVWFCQGGSQSVSVCHGNIVGHFWAPANLSAIAPSTKWHTVSATALLSTEGTVWAQQPNSDMVCFTPNKEGRMSSITPPEPGTTFVRLCAIPDSVWGLVENGDIYIRQGVTKHYPQGHRWIKLDLRQLGSKKLISLFCGSHHVWGVDAQGEVYFRVGTAPPAEDMMVPVWMPVDGATSTHDSQFIDVVCSGNDKMVWALDNKGCVYVRKGIVDTMFIGTCWQSVPGLTVRCLVISDYVVYVLDRDNNLYMRCGICDENVMGNYWKKLPGLFTQISVSSHNYLWAIDLDGHLCKRAIQYIERQGTKSKSRRKPRSPDDDWELLEL